VSAQQILTELQQFLQENPTQDIDYITLSGSGEPLLNVKIKMIIEGIKHLAPLPVALITNSALLVDEALRKEILGLDLIVPSLDAATQDVFQAIDRPCNTICIEQVIEGLIALRKEFSGKLWLEIMLVKGVNDDVEYMRSFKEVIEKIQPDKIHLNVAARPPSEAWVKAPSLQRLKQIKSILGEKCEIVSDIAQS